MNRTNFADAPRLTAEIGNVMNDIAAASERVKELADKLGGFVEVEIIPKDSTAAQCASEAHDRLLTANAYLHRAVEFLTAK